MLFKLPPCGNCAGAGGGGEKHASPSPSIPPEPPLCPFVEAAHPQAGSCGYKFHILSRKLSTFSSFHHLCPTLYTPTSRSFQGSPSLLPAPKPQNHTAAMNEMVLNLFSKSDKQGGSDKIACATCGESFIQTFQELLVPKLDQHVNSVRCDLA